MKTLSIKVALATTLSLFGIAAFASIEDSILFYLKFQTNKVLQSNFTQKANETDYVASYKRIQQAEGIGKSSFEADGALHELLREIALCR